MNVKRLSNGDLVLMNCIISYPHLFQPRAVGRPGQQTGKPRYSANFVLPADLTPEDLQVIQTAAAEAIAVKFPNGTPAVFGQPWKNAADMDASLQGRYCLAANRREEDGPPDVFGQAGRLTADQQSQVFAGCIVNAHIRFFSYNTGGNGLTAALNGVQLVDNQNVKRLDNRMSSADAFGIQEGFASEPSAPAAPASVPVGAPAPGGAAPGVAAVPAPGAAAPAPAAVPTPGADGTTPPFLG